MNEFSSRRESLFSQISDNSLVLVSSGSEQIRNRDVEYDFRAESSFFYLTGFEEPDAVLCLLKKAGECQSILFLRTKDVEQEIWQGRRLGVEAAPEQLKLDLAFDIELLSEEVESLIEDIQSVYFSFAELADWAPMLEGWLSSQKAKARQGVQATHTLKDADNLLHEARLIKSSAEIEIMRKAAQISMKGHLAALKIARGGSADTLWEYQIQAALEAEFKHRGSPRVAFSSIVAGGENACVLHYTENTLPIQQGDLVLVDAGAEYQGYAGDITSTFPANGKFSLPQKRLYELTLKAQQAVIALIAPGVLYNELHQTAAKVITEGLVSLGILKGNVDSLMEDNAYKPFFMHGTGHWLGMDVHDVGDYKQQGEWRALQIGMVLTVEPGIYISEEVGKAKGVDAQYWNIGIRIEDDVVVTETGADVLSVGLPRTVAEIEAFMADKTAS